MSNLTTTPTALDESSPKTAITYLRVSTADQATRGGREEVLVYCILGRAGVGAG